MINLGTPRPLPLSDEEYATFLRGDLSSFTTRAFHELNPATRFLPSLHIDLICSKLQHLAPGARLIINVPPRSLKSHCATVAFPAWLLGREPSRHVICASYGQELANKLARDCRALMQSSFYRALFGPIVGDRDAVHDYSTVGQGSRRATSVGGAITGLGADVLILDDIQKPDETLGEVTRRAANHWFTNTALSRLNSQADGIVIIVMQRLHQDDLVGHVLEAGGGWEVLKLPAIAEADETFEFATPFGPRRFTRHAGEALHPARTSLARLEAIRQEVGPFTFSGQYQQRPTPLEGVLVNPEWLRRYNAANFDHRSAPLIQSWDTANKVGELNDYSACTTWARVDNDFYLIDVFRRKLTYPDLRDACFAQYHRFAPSQILVEDKASGTQLIQELGSALPVIGIMPPPGVEKMMRFRAQTTLFASGRVSVPTEAPWLADYLDEITNFPGSRHDDQVDSTSMALEYLRGEADALRVWAQL